MQTNIRKWGNSAGAILPAAALIKAGIALGDTVEVNVCDGQITLKQASPKYSLEQLLKASPASKVKLDDEDREWINETPVGKEKE
ncbi:MAG: hypothetical protein KUG73_07475 [Pseudomonadales bacterium]|nr:hypothetical protein [Pseudomonadales bacterium]